MIDIPDFNSINDLALGSGFTQDRLRQCAARLGVGKKEGGRIVLDLIEAQAVLDLATTIEANKQPITPVRHIDLKDLV